MVKLGFWISAFVIGLGLFVYGIVRLFRKKDSREGRFAWAALFEFLAGWVLFIPDEFYNDIPKSKPVLHVIESVVTALVKTFNIYLGDAFNRVEALKGTDYSWAPVFASVYGTLAMLTNAFILLLVAGFLASFLDGALQRIRLFFRRNRRIVVFSVCNEKTLAIAESIPSKAKKPVFANCGKNTDGAWKERIAVIGGVRFDASVSEVLRKVVGRKLLLRVLVPGANDARARDVDLGRCGGERGSAGERRKGNLLHAIVLPRRYAILSPHSGIFAVNPAASMRAFSFRPSRYVQR